MNRSTFFKSLGLALLSTPLLSFKNKSTEKDCLDFDLSHYKFTDEELTVSKVTLLKGQKYYDTIVDKPEGRVYYAKTVNREGVIESEFWALRTKDYKRYHKISYDLNYVSKKFDDFKTNISREITIPMK